MTSGLTAVFDALDPERLARFWGGVLGREVAGGAFLPGPGSEVGLRFVPGRARSGLNRVHLHVTSDHPEQQEQTVAAALELGGRHLDVGQLPEETHVVLADPEGNEFCVIEAGNSFLAGTGRLGELACDGTRAVGQFWSAALGWPLVWDQDEETAVQSPSGGTKVAWGGPPLRPVPAAGNRQRFEIHGDAERLIGLGASRLGDGTLADPDGNPFLLRA